MKKLWVVLAIGFLVITCSPGYAAPPILVPGTPHLHDLSNLYPNVEGTWQGSVSLIEYSEDGVTGDTYSFALEITDQTNAHVVGSLTWLDDQVLLVSGYISGHDIYLSVGKLSSGATEHHLYKFQLDGQLTDGVPLSPTTMQGAWIGSVSQASTTGEFTASNKRYIGHFTFTRNVP